MLVLQVEVPVSEESVCGVLVMQVEVAMSEESVCRP